MAIKRLKAFVNALTRDERKALAAELERDSSQISHYANDYQDMQPRTAARIEAAVKKMRRRSPHLPAVTRGDLSSECKRCPYFAAAGEAGAVDD